MKILVTGASGQLGSEIKELSTNYTNDTFIFVDREEMALDDLTQVLSVIENINPDLIISGGAYTAVDKAESEEKLVDIINHQAVAKIAEWVKQNNRKLIHISTDYVFQGTSSTPLKENEPTNPINVYGLTKQKGEEAIISSDADAIIIRTAWVYSSYGANFVKTMIRLMTDREEISVIGDQVGSPTYAYDLAQVILNIVHSDRWVKGVYHFSNEGEISWYDFAVAIKELKNLNCNIKPITTAEYPTAAKRPNYSLLDKTKIKQTFGVTVPEWKQSLVNMLGKI
ncbi:dTDP-4-dehydrorhamnose reductase [Sphingobacterium sp.]|uniref:dTDP-4-dehydrorhamnose reductase n=1 Tax=Sphingobacterium sp. TaxID=341027 RepID=UPI0025883453|nr:dTDP-4-dehydrorhamnose reductase [Sphingobacterium sp.]WET70818.1 MAG: dTDP-4-dehydrorhamnose reductase [Sphingobacterium sp.]